jgi:preprotein translocase subunit SecE
MGKVRDEAPAAKSAKPVPKGTTARDARRRVVPFVANLFRSAPYKPTQGWYARLWTGIGLGTLLAVGVLRLYDLAKGLSSPAARLGIPALAGAIVAWFVFRLIHYPPFADFLIATEAEMNKVSWTSKADLKRATSVVLVTVALMSIFLFGVDWVWSSLLQYIGVLRFNGGGAFGSTAG